MLKNIFSICTALMLTITIPLLCQGKNLPHSHTKPDFKTWLAAFKKEAVSDGIPSRLFDIAFTNIVPNPKIIQLDHKQPESTLSLNRYIKRAVSKSRILAGIILFEKYRDFFMKINRIYGIPPQYLIALWGIESNFGHSTGRFYVIQSLTTLAFDGRRKDFFRKELIAALHIAASGHVTLKNMTGSWAGAMGQFQFMPSTFLKFAVDYDGDKRIDIWNNHKDAIASAANYMSSSGWKKDMPWGVEVELPDNMNSSLLGLAHKKLLSEWQKLGVRCFEKDMNKYPDIKVSIIRIDGPQKHFFAVYDNYRVLLKWNRSHLFAISVGELADRIAQGLIRNRGTDRF
jgi:membrane-bound lytic murein transglycosylase B